MKRLSKSMAAIALSLSILAAGCSKAPAPSADNGKSSAEKPIEISWLSFDFPEEDGSYVQQWMEKKFNVKIKNIRIDRTNWKDQLNVRLATNELPDVWLLWGLADVRAYSQQGLLAELPIEEIKKNMPTLADFVNKNQPEAWNDGVINGKSYGIPITNLEGVIPLNPFYNQDWLKAVGYNEPPKTLKEFEDVIYKFRNNDPDGNGKKDTYGLTALGKTNIAESLQYVFGAYQTNPSYWVKDKEGKLVYGMVTEQSREAFRSLNKWFKDGVLDPEFLTSDGKRGEFVNKRVGVDTHNWSNFRPNGVIGLAAAKNGVKIVAGKALDGPYGTGKLSAWGLTGNYLGMSVDAGKDPKKKAKIYEILNSMYSDKESFMATQYGEEGVHYTMQNGMPVPKEEYVDTKKKISAGLGSYYGLLSKKAKAFETYSFPASDLALREQVTQGVETLFNIKFNINAVQKYPDLPNLEKEHFIKFITGEIDLDKGFDKFVESWKKAGGEEITNEVNATYKAQQSGKK
ncbi:extracellular solute-binding protein [Paenibacillus silviterrae]|uniref:extracellular solute-binding protein n=1 Tax=Paenibacillus silviterrae TaxID=3242194 RepID=UPI002543A854|nr:extracellular solute-binding protein [Paenibacillus chinjuensis]